MRLILRRARHIQDSIHRKFKNEQKASLRRLFPLILKSQILLWLLYLLIEVSLVPGNTGYYFLGALLGFILLESGLLFFAAETFERYMLGLHATVILLFSMSAVGLLYSLFSGSHDAPGLQEGMLAFYIVVMSLSFLSAFPLRPFLPILLALPLGLLLLVLSFREDTVFLFFPCWSFLFPVLSWILLTFLSGVVEKIYFREFRMRYLAERRQQKVLEQLRRAEQLNTQLEDVRKSLEKEIEDRKATEKTLEQFAAFDELTNVYNRRAGLEVLKEALHYANRNTLFVTIAFVDLDALKEVNDNHGHEAGDSYLREVVGLLRKHLRKSDAVSRYGGDEFLVVLSDCREGEARAIFSRMEEDMREMNREQRLYPISFSYGFAEAAPGEEDSYNRLIALADERMYVNKQNKRMKR